MSFNLFRIYSYSYLYLYFKISLHNHICYWLSFNTLECVFIGMGHKNVIQINLYFPTKIPPKYICFIYWPKKVNTNIFVVVFGPENCNF